METTGVVLSHFQGKTLLYARNEGIRSVSISLDLNRSISEVAVDEGGVYLPDGQKLNWDQVAEIADRDTACYTVRNSEISRIFFFSDTTKRQCSLLATEKGAPTMLLAGFPMHRIKTIDPWEDTRRKIATIAPVSDRVLDTATGLGYTAIAAAETAIEVVTIELDPTVLEVCRRNPWSEPLFANPLIQQKIGSSYDRVPEFPDRYFARIFHDPPTFKLAGELYSGVFYQQLYRVLKPKGKLFHYIGDPDSKHGASTTRGVIRRLKESGFTKVVSHPEAFGVVAWK
ncbi:MAG: methyltransferase domain-containing protein [Armatimonadaceae bacterium]